MMLRSWHGSIIFRVGLLLLILLTLLGILTVGLTLEYTKRQEQIASTQRLNQLLDTVESTVSVACFAQDDVLASELTAGLLKNSEVLAVEIRSSGKTLAIRQRYTLSEAEQSNVAASILKRSIYSPFVYNEQVGEIILTPNHDTIRAILMQELRITMIQMALQLIVIALGVIGAMLLLIVHPIKIISYRLDHMQATKGDRLSVPKWHHNSEISLLVSNVNRLADDLVKALHDERNLRIQHEIDQRRYHAIFQNAETGIFILDAQGIIRSWNPAFQRLLHLSIENQQLDLSLFGFTWVEPAQLAELLLHSLGSNASTAGDLQYQLHDNRLVWLHIVLTPLGDRSFQGVIYDVTQHKEALATAAREALTDQLTGLINRQGLEKRLGEILHENEELLNFALIFLDFKDFHRINEGFGLPVGDEILKEATRRLSSCVKNTDLLARLQGDLFALALFHLRRDLDAERVSGRLLDALSEPYILAGSPIKLSVRLGIAMYPQDADDGIPTLLRHAELALSQAKIARGNYLCFFDPVLAAAAEGRRRLENDLRRAVETEQFILFFQPIVDLKKNRLAGAEVLIRWQHPERGLIPPDDFIPLAEETGLINEIGLWALQVAGQQLAEWQMQGFDWYLSVNVSGRQIPDGLPPEVVMQTAQHYGFNPDRLALEITEGILLNDVTSALTWLNSIHNKGFSVYLDDFGTGYSSLSYLKRFSVDRLKIDKSFIRDIANNANDQALVAAIIAMAQSLTIDVIAEGIEDSSHVNLLKKMGCRYGQGYYFSRPVPIKQFTTAITAIPDLLQLLDSE
jgi:diguanylate cyclase (GGDEF)-like protein/PAS domain S-box-containing protein